VNRLRLGLAIGGFVLAVAGVVLNEPRLAWAAIALLAGSAIVRLIQRKRDETDRDSDRRV
jgi:hypothetical protein